MPKQSTVRSHCDDDDCDEYIDISYRGGPDRFDEPFPERRVLDLPCIGARDGVRIAVERQALAGMSREELCQWLIEREVISEAECTDYKRGRLEEIGLEYRGLNKEPDQGPSAAAAAWAKQKFLARVEVCCQSCGADGIYEGPEFSKETHCCRCGASRADTNPMLMMTIKQLCQ